MQKIYSGKQLDILYAQAAQLDKLSAQDHIERAAVALSESSYATILSVVARFMSLLVQVAVAPMP